MKASEDVATSISADALASFGQAVIAFAGLWPLPHTTLHGPFQLTQIVVLLPTTLQSRLPAAGFLGICMMAIAIQARTCLVPW